MFAQVVDTLSEVGLRDALVQHRTGGEHLYDSAFTLQLMRAAITAAFVALAAPYISVWFGDARLVLLLDILAALSLVGGFENVAYAEFRRNLKFEMEFRILFVPRIAQVVVAIGAALETRSYFALIAGIATSKIIRLAMTYYYHPYRPRLRLDAWREIAGFSLWSWASSVIGIAWDKTDAFVVAPVLGATVFGTYLLAGEVAMLPITELIGPVAAVLFPAFATANRESMDDGISPITAMLVLSALASPAALALSAFSGLFVPALLGTKWLAAIPLVAYFASVNVIAPASYVSSSFLRARGGISCSFVVVGISSAAKLIGTIIVIRWHDILAVVWVSASCVFLEASLYFVALLRAGVSIPRGTAGTAIRLVISGCLVSLAAYGTGLGWSRDSVFMSRWAELGLALGASIALILSFGVVMAIAWVLSGSSLGTAEGFVATMLRSRWWNRRRVAAAQ